MEKQTQLLIGHRFDDRYEIQELVGCGGMGEVYRAYHLQMEKPVAIKVLRPDLLADPKALQRFRQEAQCATGLKHDNIAHVQTFGVAENKPYIVMDILEGESLQAVLQREGRLGFERFCKIFLPVCEALEYAHAQGIIHRDLKPANIYIDKPGSRDERIVLVDFGIAKVLTPEGSEDQQAQKMTKTGTALGTPDYMSPEQCRAEPPTVQSDIYSLGCVMYHAAYGKPPFSAETPYALMMQHGYEDAALNVVPAGYPNGIIGLMRKTMSKAAADRYGTAKELKDDLIKLQQGHSLSELTPGGTSIPRRLFRNPEAILISAVVLFVVPLLSVVAFMDYMSAGAQVRRFHDKHDFAQLKREVIIDSRINPERAVSVVCAALPDIAVAQSIDGLETLAIGARLMGSNKQLPQMGRIVEPAAIVFGNLPAETWRDQYPRILPLAIEIGHYAHSSNDDVVEECTIALRAAQDSNQPAALALARDALRRQRGRIDPPSRGYIYDSFARLSETLAPFDLELSRALLSQIDLSTTPEYKLQAALAHGRLEDRFGHPDLALAWWERACQLATDTGKQDESFLALQSLADDELLTRRQAVAIEHLDRVHSYLTHSAPLLTTARMVRLAEAYWYAGEDAKSKVCIKQALAIAPIEFSKLAETGKLALIPETEWAQAVAYMIAGDRKKSSDTFMSASDGEVDDTKPIRFSIWSAMAESLPQSAVKQFAMVCWSVQRRDYIGAGRQLQNLAGDSSLSEAQREVALLHAAAMLSSENQLSDAIGIFKHLETAPFVQDRQADILSRIADCQYRNGDFSGARQTCDRFLEQKARLLTSDRRGKFSLALVSLRYGQLRMRDGSFAAARESFDNVLHYGRAYDAQVEKLYAGFGFMNATRELGDWAGAKLFLPTMTDLVNPNTAALRNFAIPIRNRKAQH